MISTPRLSAWQFFEIVPLSPGCPHSRAMTIIFRFQVHKGIPRPDTKRVPPSHNLSEYHKLLQPFEPMDFSPISPPVLPLEGALSTVFDAGWDRRFALRGITDRGGAKAANCRTSLTRARRGEAYQGPEGRSRPKGCSGDKRQKAPGAQAEAGSLTAARVGGKTIARSFGLRTAPPFSLGHGPGNGLLRAFGAVFCRCLLYRRTMSTTIHIIGGGLAAAKRRGRRPRRGRAWCCTRCAPCAPPTRIIPTGSPSSSVRTRSVPTTRRTTPSACCTRRCAARAR